MVDSTKGSRVKQAELARLDAELFAIWNLGDNVLLGWTMSGRTLLVLWVRHYEIADSVYAGSAELINEILAGPKRLEPDAFGRICRALDATPKALAVALAADDEGMAAQVSEMLRRYGVSLVRNRAVLLIDAVEFSLRPPIDQMAMLNSLSYSVNSAYGQLLSKNIKIDFARTTTGDGFYIWNRATTAGANAQLYKLMIMLLADNAVAQRKARSPWVPKLRAAFHIGDHYEFHQVEGLNPTTFSYIVGQVTVDLSRMVGHALPGQILLGDFDGTEAEGTLAFVENTAATLKELNGLDVSGSRIGTIRCYVTGDSLGGGRYAANRYHLRDKHGTMRAVYNAKINIHRENAQSIFLGMQGEDLAVFNAVDVESVSG
jgi:hypothetical protein